MTVATTPSRDCQDGRDIPRARHPSDAVAGSATGGAAASLPPPVTLSPVTLRIPTPPSVNQAYRNTPAGRAKTQAYTDWVLTAYQMIKSSGCGAVHGRCGIVIGVEREAHMSRADLDNRAKLILDALVSACVIDDDRNVTFLAMSWMAPANGLAHIAIFPAGMMPVLEPHASSNGATGAWVIRLQHPEQEIDDHVTL